MRRAAALHVAIVAAALAASASAQTSTPGGKGMVAGQTGAPNAVITQPVWAVYPRVEFPELALSQGIQDGRVGLECTVANTGRLSGCQVVSEQPEGVNFGRAAIRGAAEARIDPDMAADLAPNAKVRFAVNFSLR